MKTPSSGPGPSRLVGSSSCKRFSHTASLPRVMREPPWGTRHGVERLSHRSHSESMLLVSFLRAVFTLACGFLIAKSILTHAIAATTSGGHVLTSSTKSYAATLDMCLCSVASCTSVSQPS